MNGNSTKQNEEEANHPRRRGLAVSVMVACLLCLVVLPWSGTATAASPVMMQENNSSLNETAPYYDNQTAVGNQTGWVPVDVTLDSMGEMATRFSTFVIGTGSQIPGGNTYTGTLMTGLVMVGVFIGAAMFTSVGATGGAVIATVAGYGLVSAGLAPRWLRVVLVIILGTVAAIAVLRTTR